MGENGVAVVDVTKDFRSYEEMDEVYQQRHLKGHSNEPYIVDVHDTKRRLIFFGSVHSSDPKHMQWPLLEKYWNEFIQSQNAQKQVFMEGRVRPVQGKTKEQAMLSDGEAGLICWMSNKSSIPVDSPEPDMDDEIEYIVNSGITNRAVRIYYFARQMLQWLTYNYKTSPDWREYAINFLNHQKKLKNFADVNMDLDSVLADFKLEAGKGFSEKDRELLYQLSNPFDSKASATSSIYRNIVLFQAIKDKWDTSVDTFVVYGSGHAIVLEPALRKLIESK